MGVTWDKSSANRTASPPSVFPPWLNDFFPDSPGTIFFSSRTVARTFPAHDH